MSKKIITVEGLNEALLNLKRLTKIDNINSIKETSFFMCNSAVPIGNVYLPKYTIGIVIFRNVTSGDAILLAVDFIKNLYVGFKNDDTWLDARVI